MRKFFKIVFLTILSVFPISELLERAEQMDTGEDEGKNKPQTAIAK